MMPGAAEIRGDWITASEKYREAVSLAPLDAHLCYRAGNSLLEAGDAEGSLQYLEKATMLAPGTIEFDLKLGEIFSASGGSEKQSILISRCSLTIPIMFRPATISGFVFKKQAK